MPSAVADVFAAGRAKPAGVVGWGEPVGPPPARAKSSTGIYVVALTDAVDRVDCILAEAPILPMALTTLLRRRPELILDGSRPTARQLAARLGEFWFPDETILYIGLADAREACPAAATSPTACTSTSRLGLAPRARTPAAGR